MSALKVFVCGVTGNQGGAVAAALLSKGAAVQSISRDTSTPKAQAATAKGIKLAQGSFDDESSLATAISGCNAAFVNVATNFFDPSGEVKQGTNVLDALKAAGIQHVVYTSGLGCDAPEKLEAFDPDSFMASMCRNKQVLEEQVRSGFPRWTILRPGHFATNYLTPRSPQYGDFYETGEWANALRKETKLAVIDMATVGAFAAAALADDSGRFDGQELPLADELIPVDEILASLGRVSGRQLRARFYTDQEVAELLKVMPPLLSHVNIRNQADFTDMERLKSFGVPLSSFDAFLDREQDAIRSAYKL